MIRYTVTVHPPQGEDDYNWTIIIGKDGMSIGRIEAPMVPAFAEMAEVISKNAEDLL
jgi:hypothetical protein